MTMELNLKSTSACEQLNIPRVLNPYSQRQPVLERFNRTIQEEFVDMIDIGLEDNEFNQRLTPWLIEYNSVRPHQALITLLGILNCTSEESVTDVPILYKLDYPLN